MRILLLIEGYKELSLPNAICLKHIINYLKKWKINVDIISAEKEDYVSTKQEFYFKYEKNNKLKYKIRRFFQYPLSFNEMIKNYFEIAEKLILERSYDAIIAVQNPTESAQALKKIKCKYPELKVIFYEIDPASNRYKFPKNCLQNFLMKRARRWEKNIYKCMDYIIHMKSHMNHYSRREYLEFENKTFYLDIPAFRIQKKVDETINNKKIKLLYAGAFYKDIRNPEKIIEILHIASDIVPIEVKMFVNEAMKDEIIDKCKDKSNFKISGYVQEETLSSLINESSCLISVGNKESDFLPSKILTYMGTQKPVIHFYYDDFDVSLPYLKKYKNAICINVNDDINKNVELLCKYLKCDLNKKSLIEKELVTQFYENTPEFTAKKILEIIKCGKSV